MAGWYHVIKTIKGNRYLYAQRTWREGGHVRTQSRYLGKAGDSGTASSSGQSAPAGLSGAGKTFYHGSEIKFTGIPSTRSNRYGKLGQGFYITDDLTTAQNYTGAKGEVKEYNLSPDAKFILETSAEFRVIKNQAIDNLKAQGEIRTPMQIDDEVRRLVEEAGYDGVQAFNQTVVFNPNILAEHVAQQPIPDKLAAPKEELTLQSPPPSDSGQTSRARPKRGDIYATVTDRIISDLERGVRPWDKPWQSGSPTRPLRFNGERYHGINIIILWLTAHEKDFSSPYWMTFNQAGELGGHVRKGEKGTGITYAGKLSRLAQDGQGELIYDDKGHELIEDIPILKSYTVFNADQIEGLPEKYRQSSIINPLDPASRIQKVDEFVKGTGADIRYGGSQAYNSADGNYIQMPPYEHFKQPEGFAATIVHELVHWTRYPSRLNREFGRERFGDEGYAMEELVAELGAAFLCAEFGISPKTREEHSSYIASWLKVLRNDKRAIFAAAAYAQKAADYLHGERKS